MTEQSWIADVVNYLDTGSTSLTAGTNLFADAMPDEVRTVILSVYEESGRPPDMVYGNTDAFVRPSVRLIARTTMPSDAESSPDPTNARNVLWQSYRRLKTVANTTLSTSSPRMYGAFEPDQAPYLYDVDEEGRHRYSFTAGVWMTPSTGPW